MSDRIREMVRRNRLLALRDALINDGSAWSYPDDFKSVFTWFDFYMVNSMWTDYVQSLESKKRVADVAPDNVVGFIRENRSVANALSISHAEWNRIRTTPMSGAIRRQSLAVWRDDRRKLLDRVKEIRQWLARANAWELHHIARPDPATISNKFMLGDIPPTEQSKRWSWYYWYQTDKGHFYHHISKPMALAYLLLWQVESHLGIPRSYTGLDWNPVFRIE